MATKAETFATQGLTEGYTGTNSAKPMVLGEIPFNSAQIHDGNSKYFDLWLRGVKIGVGTEVILTDEDNLGRQYSGGIVASEKQLKMLGITAKQIIEMLKVFINNLTTKTRFFQECPPIVDGKWTYKYEITYRDEDTGVVNTKESMLYGETLVFVHNFQLTPIK